MRKIVLLLLVFTGLIASPCWAAGVEAELSVGNTSVEGGVHFINDMANGFWKAGGSVLYTDDDYTEYKWLELDFTVGNELVPGLTCEVGLKGIAGEAEDYGVTGDVGAVAFAGRVVYVFPKQGMPVPVEAFAGLAYAPEILSFQDTEDYLAGYIGIGVRIVRNATIILKYNAYDVDLESGPGKWNLDDGQFRLGLVMRF